MIDMLLVQFLVVCGVTVILRFSDPVCKDWRELVAAWVCVYVMSTILGVLALLFCADFG